jgi:glycine cleavage system regulatory protein
VTQSLVLTFIGHDRPGLVNAISDKIAAVGGNWLESRLEHLAGQFAGIALISVPAPRIQDLSVALRELETEGLSVTIAHGSVTEPEEGYETLTLDLLGHDRPGIVRDVTQTLTRLGVNIEEFSSFIESAPFTGEAMFRAALRLRVPEHVAADDVRQTLEKLADEIMVDIKTWGEA